MFQRLPGDRRFKFDRSGMSSSPNQPGLGDRMENLEIQFLQLVVRDFATRDDLNEVSLAHDTDSIPNFSRPKEIMSRHQDCQSLTPELDKNLGKLIGRQPLAERNAHVERSLERKRPTQ